MAIYRYNTEMGEYEIRPDKGKSSVKVFLNGEFMLSAFSAPLAANDLRFGRYDVDPSIPDTIDDWKEIEDSSP